MQCMGYPGTSEINPKLALHSVRWAIANGADAISLQVPFFSEEALKIAFPIVSTYIEEAHGYNLPVLIMVSTEPDLDLTPERFTGATTSLTEWGADLVKISCPVVHSETDAEVILQSVAFSAPILLAGGRRSDNFPSVLRTAVSVGFSGFCLGRNVFLAASPDAVLHDCCLAFSATRNINV